MQDFSKEIVTGLLSVNEWHLAFDMPLTDLHSFYTIFTKKEFRDSLQRDGSGRN
jgi:hypothetical protein